MIPEVQDFLNKLQDFKDVCKGGKTITLVLLWILS